MRHDYVLPAASGYCALAASGKGAYAPYNGIDTHSDIIAEIATYSYIDTIVIFVIIK